MKRSAFLVLCFVSSALLLHSSRVAAQVQAQGRPYGALPERLDELVDTPRVSGYAKQLAHNIRASLKRLQPATDNLGDVVITIGSGAPHRLIVAPIDEPGFVVSEITPDRYL